MNIAYTRYGDFPTLEACNATPTNCHSGYYTSAVGTDAYMSKPACWSPTGDNKFKPYCKLHIVDDEAQAKKVFEDFGSDFPSASYWYLMGEWCSRNQGSPYCPNMINVEKNKWLWRFFLGMLVAIVIVFVIYKFTTPPKSSP